MAPKTILIAGAGVAGPACALLLSGLGHKCTIVERSPQFRTSGQQIDVSGEALKDNEVIAEFPTSKSGGLVKELEILRPDLANAFFEKTKDSVEYVFGDYITGVEQHKSGATVSFANQTETQVFDIVIAADGLRSKTRQLVFDESNTTIVELGVMAGFFDIPYEERDGMWSRLYSQTNGRSVLLRPNKANGSTSTYLCQCTPDAARIAALSPSEQRQEVNRIFGDVSWEAPRVLSEVNSERGERFYLQEGSQAKSRALSNGRVVLLGDSGYCPSPLSGEGTTLALIGAYMLAGCIAMYDDHREALTEYEKRMRPFIDRSQKLPPGTPWIVNPQTATGISVLNHVLWVMGKTVNSRIGDFLGWAAAPIGKLFGEGPKLPEFPALNGSTDSMARS